MKVNVSVGCLESEFEETVGRWQLRQTAVNRAVRMMNPIQIELHVTIWNERKNTKPGKPQHPGNPKPGQGFNDDAPDTTKDVPFLNEIPEQDKKHDD